MCGRFSLKKQQQDLEYYYLSKLRDQGYSGPSYNVAPSQYAPVMTPNGLELMKWGLIPQWATSAGTGYTMINAKAETLFEKTTYKKPIITQRCLVPATGFYEWLTTEKGKVPFYFQLPDRPLFSFAGLYISRTDSEDHELKTFTIITTTPNTLVAQIHDRMPVILSKEEEKDWLDREVRDQGEIESFLDPYPAEQMQSYEVSKEVGSVRNNYPELTERVS